jgi:hypothetical protein
MNILESKPRTTSTKADALAKLSADIGAAAARAEDAGIDAREVATILEGQAAYYRQRDAMFRAVR